MHGLHALELRVLLFRELENVDETRRLAVQRQHQAKPYKQDTELRQQVILLRTKKSR
jgi:hypothetical protein